MRIPDLKEEDITLLEQEMDRMNEVIPPMKSFILPGGHPTLSQLHIARCVCRRAERCCVRLDQESGNRIGLVIGMEHFRISRIVGVCGIQRYQRSPVAIVQ